MKTYHIAVIPGDGIGNEVIPESIKALAAVAETQDNLNFEFDYFPWGCEYNLQHGHMMPGDGLRILAEYDADPVRRCGIPNRS